MAALETEQQNRQLCRRSERRVGCCLLPAVSVTESPGTGYRPAPPPWASACCAPPMPDWFWSLWQTIKYPPRAGPRSTDPPCVFVQDPALDVPIGLYQDCATIPPKTGRSSRVVFISDTVTHGRHDTVREPPGDALCHCGDIMMMGGKILSVVLPLTAGGMVCFLVRTTAARSKARSFCPNHILVFH